MIKPPKYVPASFEKHSLTGNFLESLKKNRENISPHLPEQHVNKYEWKPVHLPLDKISHFARKEVKDNLFHLNPTHFNSFQLVDSGFNELWGIPKHKTRIEPVGVEEFEMKGVSDSDLMIMRLQNENGTDNKLSQVLDEKGLPGSLDEYVNTMESRIKDKYSKLRQTKQGSIEKVKNDINNFKNDAFVNVQESDPKTKREIKRMENKIKFKKDQLDIINKTEQNVIDDKIIPHRERKERRRTKILVNPPILSTPVLSTPIIPSSETGLDSHVPSVAEEVKRIESGNKNALEYYKEKLKSNPNKRQNYTESLGNIIDTANLIEILKESNVPMEKMMNKKGKPITANQMLKLIQSLDPNTPAKQTRKYSPRKTRSSANVIGDD